MKKVILMYPPNNPNKRIKSGYSFLNKKSSLPFINYACNDLGYIGAGLENKGFDVFLKDYKTENLTPLDVLDDILHYEPDAICLMTNPYSLGDDLKIARMMKSSSPETNIILCSDLFFNPDEKFLDSLNLTGIDYMVSNDAEFVVPELIYAIFNNNSNISEIPYILYNRHNTWVKNSFDEQKYDINNLPLVARDLMNNNIYTRKDTERPVATIYVSSEKTVFNPQTEENVVFTIGRRTPKSVFDEMLLCFNEYAIKDFYMESESFAKDEQWVTELCSMIDDSIMAGEINWFAKVKVGQVSELSTQQMQISGCIAVSVNYLSGSDETIQKIQKNISFDECVETAKILKLADLKTYGEFFIGFPWEDFSNLQDTKDLIYKTLPNVLIISLVLPFPGSNEEKLWSEMGVIKNPLIINSNLTIPVLGTKYLTNQHLNDFRTKINSFYYVNPKYILGRVKELTKQPKELEEYFNKVKDFCLKFIKKG